MRFIYLILIALSLVVSAFAHELAVGDEVVLSAPNANGVPLHRLPQSSLIGFATNGAFGTIEEVAPSERWVRVAMDDATVWVLARNASLASDVEPEIDVTIGVDQSALLDANCENTGNRELLEHSLFTVCFDKDWRIPVWVGYELRRGAMSGPGDRGKSSWEQDQRIEELLQASDKDYAGKGWHKGHMAPAHAFTRTQAAVDFTHIYSNAVPQSGNVNSGAWAQLEAQVRALVEKGATVWVYTGGLSLELPPECLELPFDTECRCLGAAGARVEPERDMSDRIAVPSHTFKTILVQDGGKWDGHAFVMTNIHRAMGNFVNYQYPISEVEERLGIELYPGLDASTAETVKSSMSPISTRRGRDRCL